MIYFLIGIVGLVTLLLLYTRTNSGVVFLAVCTGSVLLSAAGKDTSLLAYSVSSGANISNNTIQALLVLAPGIVSAVFLRKRVTVDKILFAVVPAFCAAVVAITLVYPFLSNSMQNTFQSSQGWSLIAQYYEFIVVLGTVSSLILIAMTLPKKKHEDGRRKK